MYMLYEEGVLSEILEDYLQVSSTPLPPHLMTSSFETEPRESIAETPTTSPNITIPQIQASGKYLWPHIFYLRIFSYVLLLSQPLT